MPTSAPNWTLEIINIAQGLLGTLIGGGLVLLGGWLSDRRKSRSEAESRNMRERALLTGMFAVRNHIAQRLNNFAETNDVARLEPLRTAQSYIHRLIDKAPSESEALMIAVVGVGLAVDSALATLDRHLAGASLRAEAFAEELMQDLSAVQDAIDQFDIVTQANLSMLSEEELSQFPGYIDPHQDEDEDEDDEAPLAKGQDTKPKN